MRIFPSGIPARTIVRGLTILTAATVLTGGICRAGSGSDSPEAVPSTLFTPVADLAVAIRQAHENGKTGVVILFEMEGCGECRKLETTAFRNDGLQTMYRNAFVTVTIKADEPVPLTGFDGGATTHLEFAAEQGIFALPTVFFYDLDGVPVIRQSGSAAPLTEWLLLGEYVRSAGYDTLPFPVWKDVQKSAQQHPPV